jgi:putative membrane protein
MGYSALFAFLHHAAAFTVFAALALEWVLIRNELTLASARSIMRADLVYGIAAGVVLVVGFLRVTFFEKGSEYYYHSAPFIAKLTLFLLIGLVSIYPTIVFLKWGKPLKEGRLPDVPKAQLRALRIILHLEQVGIFIILLAAALMARGIGYFG